MNEHIVTDIQSICSLPHFVIVPYHHDMHILPVGLFFSIEKLCGDLQECDVLGDFRFEFDVAE